MGYNIIMKPWLSNTFLNIPIIVWVLQLFYVLIALSILFFIYPKTHKKTVLVIYILAMIAINIIWRLAISKIF
jgi:hypothetical protein